MPPDERVSDQECILATQVANEVIFTPMTTVVTMTNQIHHLYTTHGNKKNGDEEVKRENVVVLRET